MALMKTLRRLAGITEPVVEATPAHQTIGIKPSEVTSPEPPTPAPPLWSGTGRAGERRQGFGGTEPTSHDMAEIERELEDERARRIEQDKISRWNGRSLDDLPMALIRSDPRSANEGALINTVPEDYRGNVSGAANGDGWPGAGENSEWRTYELAEILAIDKKGEALVCRTDYNDYLGAESFIIKRMPQEDAFGMVDRLRAETVEPTPTGETKTNDVKALHGPGRLEAADQSTKVDPMQVNHAARAAMAAGMMSR